ncbi:hypothetical protein [Moorena sp. SIO3I6]|uniref:hypothetical protein n=1 Tax=Moorena sp. SIO3I6 TaxID=2607831 RepID=UPI0013F6A34F|nr:hypothetical protein [Moorena sp. SIO3I6]NEP24761.1 hypothetical protein [Moorena sp. SIO3I6]
MGTRVLDFNTALPTSDFRLLALASSLLPAPCSLKLRYLYLTSLRGCYRFNTIGLTNNAGFSQSHPRTQARTGQ